MAAAIRIELGPRPWRRALLAAGAAALAVLLILPRFPDGRLFFRSLLFLLFYAAFHAFVYRRLAAGFALGVRSRRWLAALFWIAGSIFPWRYLRGVLWLGYAAGVWTGAILLVSALLIPGALAGRFFPARRRLWTWLSLGLGLLLAVLAWDNARRVPVVREAEVILPGAPVRFRFTLVGLADLHLGGVESPAWLIETVDRVNGLHPDLIVLGGDLLERDPPPAEMETVRRLRARLGVLAVPGNHEFYMDVDRFSRLAARMGITVLRNRSVTLENAVQVAGLDDPAGWRFHNGGPDLDRALSGVRPDRPLILISHSPEVFPAAVRGGVQVQFSGHTHDGQLAPWSWLVRLFFRYPAGFHRRGGSCLWSSCGAGVWGIPMRLGSRNEMVRLVLRGP